MIQTRKLGHIVLKVRDAQKSKDFYTRVLGLKLAYEDLEHGAVFLSFGSQHHDLALFQLATGETPEAAQPGLHHSAWQLGSFEDLQAAHRELRELGVAVACPEHRGPQGRKPHSRPLHPLARSLQSSPRRKRSIRAFRSGVRNRSRNCRVSSSHRSLSTAGMARKASRRSSG